MAKPAISTHKVSPFQKTGAFLRKLAVAATAAILLAAAPAFAAKYAGVVVDANTGKVLYSEDAGGLRYPASLTKMMTLYLVFEALESGKIRKDSPVPMTAHAAAEPPSKLGLPAGRTFTVEQGILALVTRSANDVAMAFAEYIGGSEANFGRMMTAKARAIGMRNTVYYNPNGLPDDRQVTTARDQATLGIALRQHFPQYYGYFSTRSFRFGKQVIGNHNRLLGKVSGVDGIKTGYTRAAGFNLATSAMAGNRSIVVVVLGEPSGATRNARVTRLVQRYLPDASNGRRTFVIAKASTPRVMDAPIAAARPAEPAVEVASADDGEDGLPNVGPVPGSRYNARRMALAYQEDKTPAPVVGKEALVAELKQTAKPAPAPAKVKAPVPPAPVETASAAPAVDELTTSSTKAEASGWIIQVGAAQSPQQAKELLQKAQEKGGKVLRSADPYTVAFNSDGAKVYRARFSGFDNQNSAMQACKQLKRRGMGCWASLN